MRLSSILAPRDLADLRREFKRSRDVFGPAASDRMRDRLLERFRQVESGTAPGHRHAAFAGAPAMIRSIAVGPLPVVYDIDSRVCHAVADTRQIKSTSLFTGLRIEASLRLQPDRL